MNNNSLTQVKSFAVPTTDQPTENDVCEFSIKVAYLKLGRICQIDKCSCFQWNKPVIFASYTLRNQLLKEQPETEL